MLGNARLALLIAGLCSAATLIQADAIEANGFCELKTCAPTDTLAPGASVQNAFSFVYTFANSDRYRASGTIGAYNDFNTTGSAGISGANLTITFLGNAAGTSSSADTLTIDFLQYFGTNLPRSMRNNSGFEYVSGVFGGPIADASSVEAQGFTNGGTAMGLMGPFYPPDSFSDSRSYQPVTGGPVTLLDFRDTLTFGAGSGVGSQIAVFNVPPASSTPEPSSLVLVAGGLAIYLNRVLSRIRRNPSNAWLVQIGVFAMILAAGASVARAQIRLPHGIKLPDPRQSTRGWPVGRPEQPNPDRVCPKMIAWIQILQNEYPSVGLMHTVSDKVQQMAVPLFADDAFEKQFGVSYPKLSDTERREFFRSHVIPCQTSPEYRQQTGVLTIFNPPFQPGTLGMGPLAPGQLIPALVRLEGARSTLHADEQALAARAPSVEAYEQATGLVSKRKDELARVWPSEKARFESAVKDAVGRSAEAAIEAKVQPLLTAPASPRAARQLRDAPGTYSALFEAVPAGQRTALLTKIEERRSAVLRELLPPQQARAESFPATRQGLDDGAEWFSAYQSVFLEPPALPEAVAIAKAYLTRREAVLANMAPQFRQKIEAAQDPDAVASMYDDVFRLADDRQTDTYRQLKTARAARASLLTKRAEQSRLAAEEKAEKAALLRGEIVASSLKVANLENARIYHALYVGDFAHVGIQRANVFFEDMLDSYLQQFGTACNDVLPVNKVEVSEPECKQSVQRTVYGKYGVVSSSTQCVVWGRRPLGMYADPRAFAAKMSLEDVAQRNGVRDFFQALGNRDPLAGAMGQASELASRELSLKQDTPQLIAQNGCRSKALARLQENMTRFANGEDPLHVAGFAEDTTKLTRAQELDVTALADDLIRANAAGWFFNRYTGLQGAEVASSLDSEGRARHIHASYRQNGMTPTGSVDIAFVDGVPACLYFADDPANCKAPSPTVVRRYEDGAYRRKSSR